MYRLWREGGRERWELNLFSASSIVCFLDSPPSASQENSSNEDTCMFSEHCILKSFDSKN